MSAQDAALAAAAGAAVLALAAGGGDWARNRRRHLDRVGWMPWQLISILACFAALGLAGLALNL